jgi:hypothetical protein
MVPSDFYFRKGISVIGNGDFFISNFRGLRVGVGNRENHFSVFFSSIKVLGEL